MKRLYGLRNDKENISLIIGDDKAMLIIQTAESFKARELNLEIDLENESKISADKVKTMGFSSNYDGGNESEVYEENGMIGVKANNENQPEPVQRALNRVKELKYITDVRIDEEFETTIDGFPENRLTITIDYLDVDFVKEARKADGYKLN